MGYATWLTALERTIALSLQSRGEKELLSCPFWDPRFDFLNGPAYSAVELGPAFADTRDECDLAGDLVKRDVGSKRLENRLNGIVRAHDVNVGSARIAREHAPPGRLQNVLEERFYAALC